MVTKQKLITQIRREETPYEVDVCAEMIPRETCCRKAIRPRGKDGRNLEKQNSNQVKANPGTGGEGLS
jgi:hypothetical protein